MIGLLQPTTRRDAVLTVVPANGPVMRMSGACGDHGSIFGSTSSHKYLRRRPLPPRYFSAHSMLSGSTAVVPALRSILSTLPL